MSIASANPFALLDNESVVRVKTEVKAVKATVPKMSKAPAAPSTNTTTATTNTSTITTTANTATNNKPQATREMNTNVPSTGKTGESTRRRGPRHSPTEEVSERTERRRTDRHSRTGRKQDSEKRMNGGKGSWGRPSEAIAESETVATEQPISVSPSVEEVVQEVTEALPARLTLAQYQAQLKKPVAAPALERRQVASLASDAQVIRKQEEVFVYPEIVKKKVFSASVPAVAAPASTINLSKYLSMKSAPSAGAASSEKSDTTRGPRRDHRNATRAAPVATTTTTTSSKLNLNDIRAFPILGKN